MLSESAHAFDSRVSLYLLDLDAGEPDEAQGVAEHALLDDADRQRAARLLRPGHARRWVRTRAALRRLLALRIGQRPDELHFSYTAAGRPWLEDQPWEFSVSHSHGAAAIAISRHCRVGVDIERIAPDRDLTALARTVFSAAEQRAFAAVCDSDAPTVFTRTWTRKEAFVKADGAGLGFGLERVTVGCGETPTLRIDGRPCKRWRLVDVSAPAGYRAALAVSCEPSTEASD